MNTDIRYLELLEEDLAEAAQREGAHAQPSHRGHRWGEIAAAAAVILVLAGAIGFLSQGSSSNDSAAPAALASGTSAPGRLQATIRQGAEQTALGGLAGAEAPEAAVPAATAPLHRSGAAYTTTTAPQTDLSKIIRDGRIGLLLNDGTFDRSVAAVTSVAQRNGGMILSSSTSNERSGTFTLRIPAKRFDQAMLQLRALGSGTGNAIMYDDRTGQDVTAQFVDLRARLSILKGQRTLLLGLRDKATSVGAILSLSSRIDAVQLQIEQIQGQLNVIDDQVAESTIKVELREKGTPETESSPGHIDEPSLGSAWDRALQGFLRVLGAVIVGLGYLIPVGLIAAVAWGVLTLVRRGRRAAS
jgi:hypothetical protein